MKLSIRIHLSKLGRKLHLLGGKLCSHNAGIELFSIKLRQMAVLAENFFMYVMYGTLGCC